MGRARTPRSPSPAQRRATVFGLMIQAGDLGAAIDQDSISAATAGTLHHISDMFFVGAELALIPFFVGIAVVAFRTGVLPKWWAAFSILVAVVLLIGPIGWAALIFGTPLWLLGTGLSSGSGRSRGAAAGGRPRTRLRRSRGGRARDPPASRRTRGLRSEPARRCPPPTQFTIRRPYSSAACVHGCFRATDYPATSRSRIRA